MVTAADVKDIATEFADVADARVTTFIAKAVRRVQRTAYDSSGKADDATIYLTAHMLSMDAKQGAAAAGPKTSESLDGYSVSFAVPTALAMSSASLASTPWGLAYMELRRLSFPRRDF